MKVILISGKAEAGKTTAANFLKKKFEEESKTAAIVPYGQYVKDTAKMLFGWNGEKDEKGRALLQYWGTDIVRKKNQDFWVDTVIRLADILESTLDYLIVDDCRFPNEIKAWQEDWYNTWNITTVRVNRPGHVNSLTEQQRQHSSETALDDYQFDITVSATNREELEQAVWEKIRKI